MKRRNVLLIATSFFLTVSTGTLFAQAKEQFVPMNGIWTGPYAAGGSLWFSGYIDYLQLVNECQRRLKTAQFWRLKIAHHEFASVTCL